MVRILKDAKDLDAPIAFFDYYKKVSKSLTSFKILSILIQTTSKIGKFLKANRCNRYINYFNLLPVKNTRQFAFKK
jgi:hypothetical protein